MSSRKCANRSNTKTIISLLRLKIGARKAARLRNYSRATSRPAHFGWWSSSRCGKPRRVQRRAALRESLATTFSIRRPFARARSARSARGASTIPKSRRGILNSQPTGARTALYASFQFRVRPVEYGLQFHGVRADKAVRAPANCSWKGFPMSPAPALGQHALNFFFSPDRRTF
jgi:hypothetical protein